MSGQPNLVGFVVAMTILASACDNFFTIETRVTSCRSGFPVARANAVLKLDRGFGEPDLAVQTDINGWLHMLINEPPSAWATLTIQAPGYNQWRRQFRGQPKAGIAICLEPQSSQLGGAL